MDALGADRAHFPELLRTTVERAIEFLAGLGGRRAANEVGAIEPAGLPMHGVGTRGAMELFATRYASLLSGSAGPRYFGFVTGGSTPAALVGDWLTSTFDQNLADAGESSSRQLALDALGMLRELVGLPSTFDGAFVTGATASTTVALAAARQWVGRRRGVDVSTDGVHAVGPITVLSGTAHSSVSKALSVIGLGRAALRPVLTLPDREAIDVQALARALDNIDGPAIVVANSGTVNTCDFDDLAAIVALRERFDFWLHVDGAFGAIAAASPTYRHLLTGIDGCDSLTVDAHKWLNVPYDCGVIFTRHLGLQGETFRNTSAYLPVDVTADSFVHLTPENSQRLRALPVWMTLAAYGRQGYAALVDKSCEHARWLGAKLQADPRFELLAPVRLNGVIFTLRDPAGVDAFIRALRIDGTAFVTPTKYRSIPAARVSITNWRTERADVERTWAAFQRALP